MYESRHRRPKGYKIHSILGLSQTRREQLHGHFRNNGWCGLWLGGVVCCGSCYHVCRSFLLIAFPVGVVALIVRFFFGFWILLHFFELGACCGAVSFFGAQVAGFVAPGAHFLLVALEGAEGTVVAFVAFVTLYRVGCARGSFLGCLRCCFVVLDLGDEVFDVKIWILEELLAKVAVVEEGRAIGCVNLL